MRRSADECAGARHAHSGFKGGSETEIRDKNLIITSDENVVRLEIAITTAFGVRGVESFAKLARKFEAAIEREGAFLFEDVVRSWPSTKGHGDEFTPSPSLKS